LLIGHAHHRDVDLAAYPENHAQAMNILMIVGKTVKCGSPLIAV
jgi:hypothetical protein